MQQNIKICIKEIDYCSNIEWRTCEIYWVNYYKKLGHPLLNLQKGGSGVVTDNMRNLNGKLRSIKSKELPVAAYDQDGNEVFHFESIVKSAQYFGLDKSTIWGACGQRKNKTAAGLRWEYLPKEEISYYKNTNSEYNKRIEVDQYDFSGRFVKHYLSIRQILREFASSKASGFYFRKFFLDQDKLWKGFYWKSTSI